jgi:endonuclease/exonuclease/phosphatase family metal-dependent hydrolase
MPDTIRIASFNVHGLGERGVDDAAVIGVLTRLLAQFDLIALQDIRSRRDDVLPELVSRLNSGGRKYDFMIGPRVGRSERLEQFAFVFDTERIETDRFQLYTVEDPEDMLHREPLVGWFRTRGPASQDAFTFSLVNMHLDPDLVQRELTALPSLLQAIAADGRGEDDIILAGDFNAGAAELGLLEASGVRAALEGVASNTRGTQLLDNFAFAASNTAEYTGRAGTYDFLRQFNMSLEQALAVSEHLPIWAEFSIIEGGRPGQVAGSASPVHRFQNGYH